MAEFETKKYLSLDGLATFWELNKAYIESYVQSKLFIGTTEEYNVANADGLISTGALVILTDGVSNNGSTDNSNSTTAVLGIATLGTMILGQE